MAPHDWSRPAPEPLIGYNIHDAEGNLLASWGGDAGPDDRQDAIDEAEMVMRLIGLPPAGRLTATVHEGRTPAYTCAIARRAFEGADLSEFPPLTFRQDRTDAVISAIATCATAHSVPPIGGRILLYTSHYAEAAQKAPRALRHVAATVAQARTAKGDLPHAVEDAGFVTHPTVSHYPAGAGGNEPLAKPRPLRRALAALCCIKYRDDRPMATIDLPDSATLRIIQMGDLREQAPRQAKVVARFLRDIGLASDADAFTEAYGR